MTVQTQNILMPVVGLKDDGAKSVKQAPDVNFQDVLGQSSNNVKTTSQQDKPVNVHPQEVVTAVEEPNKQPDVEQKTEDFTDDFTKLDQETLELMEDVFGLSEQQIVDIMQQLGITMQDLFVAQPEQLNASGETDMTLTLNIDVVKDIVMEVHGVDNPTVFLTNETVSQEFSELCAGLEEAMTQLVSEHPELSKEQLATKLQQFVNQGMMDEPENIIPAEMQKQEMGVNQEVQNQIFENVEDVENTLTPTTMEDGTMDHSSESNDFQSQDKSNQTLDLSKASSKSQNVRGHNEAHMTIGQFSQKLNQAFEVIGKETMIPKDISKIVTQVVDQIKIRVLPETTQMELTLNPASLGKVNLSISSQNGVSSATLTVQDHAAKEALESQMVLLKQTFDEKGIKVQSVEVNVSEFGFEKGEEPHKQNNQPNSRHRRQLPMEEEEVSQGNVPIGEDSIIDFTA